MLKEQITSLDNFVKNFDDLISKINSTQTPLILTRNDSPVAVIQTIEEYQKLIKAVSMLKLLLQGEKDVQRGKTKKQEDVFSEIERFLESKT